MQSRRNDVERFFVVQLQDVFAQIGLHCLDAGVFQMSVEMNLLGGHRFGFDDDLHTAFAGEVQDERRRLGPVLGPDHLAAARFDVALQFLEIVIEVV